MNDPDDFLTRWSRRKRSAAERRTREGETIDERVGEQRAAESAKARKAPPSSEAGADEADTSKVDTNKLAEPIFDLSKLPPIESITAETDIRAFLAPSVPAELRLAALRRAWAADPMVRDFVGLADYDFDYNTPGALAGFGPLELNDELRRELVRMAGALQQEPSPSKAQPSAAAVEASTQAAPPEPAAATDQGAESEHLESDQDELIANKNTMQRTKESAAPQQEQQSSENLQTLARRGHGGALPQ